MRSPVIGDVPPSAECNVQDLTLFSARPFSALALVAAANPVYTEAAQQATVLVSASVVVTAIMVPLVTAWWASRVAR